MRIRNVVVAVGALAIVLAAAVARAEGPAPGGPGGPGGMGPGPRHAPLPPHVREKILEKFDADGDGQLNDAERAAARVVEDAAPA